MDKEKYTSIFDNIDDAEFEEMLKECGFEYYRVQPGQGGLMIDGKMVDSSSINDSYNEFKQSVDCSDEWVEGRTNGRCGNYYTMEVNIRYKVTGNNNLYEDIDLEAA